MSDNHETNPLVEVSCAFWFSNNEQVRSPFPKDIQAEVKRSAKKEFGNWLDNLDQEHSQDVNDEEMVRVFEGFYSGKG